MVLICPPASCGFPGQGGPLSCRLGLGLRSVGDGESPFTEPQDYPGRNTPVALPTIGGEGAEVRRYIVGLQHTPSQPPVEVPVTASANSHRERGVAGVPAGDMRAPKQQMEVSLPLVLFAAITELRTKGEGVEVAVDVGAEQVAVVGAAKVGFQAEPVIEIRGR